jgi:hypothetical protein
MSTIDEIRREYEELKNPPVEADARWKRARGNKLELIINKLLNNESLFPRTRYRPDGEEIDGSFVYGGRVFLLEAKWHGEEMPASSIYEFKGKVDGKLIGTIGVFISLSGYSKDAVEALGLGKTLNVILFDVEDFEACLNEGGFTKVFTTKLRAAAEEGVVYFPYRSTTVEVSKAKRLGFNISEFESTEELVDTESAISENRSDTIIICEGLSDELVLSYLSKEILKNLGMEKRITIVPAMGKRAIPRLANTLQSLKPKGAKVIFVADSDGDIEGTRRLLSEGLEYQVPGIIIIHPMLEAWLFPGEDNPKEHLLRLSRKQRVTPLELLRTELQKINTEELQKVDESFKVFVESLIK